MKVSLFKSLDEQGKKDVEASFKASKYYREQLITVLYDKIEHARINSQKESGYNNPNWAYKQADNIGYERGLRELISLLKD